MEHARECQQKNYTRRTLQSELAGIPARLAGIDDQIAARATLPDLKKQRDDYSTSLDEKRWQVLEVEESLQLRHGKLEDQPEPAKKYAQALNSGLVALEAWIKGEEIAVDEFAGAKEVMDLEDQLNTLRDQGADYPLLEAALQVADVRQQRADLGSQIRTIRGYPSTDKLQTERDLLIARRGVIEAKLNRSPPAQACSRRQLILLTLVAILALTVIATYVWPRPRPK